MENSHRLSNLEKLYRVPVYALRELLESRSSDRKLVNLRQAELVVEADRSEIITEADVEDLYENYRYGRRQLSFYLYLLTEGLPGPELKDLQEALDLLIDQDHPDLSDEVLASEDYEAETSPNQIILLDGEQLNGIREIRFRYYVVHRFLNADELPDSVLQTRYGFLWLDPGLGYLAILTRDERVNGLLTQALAHCLQALLLPVHFAKELLDKHFSIEKVKRVSHYDPGTGMRQTLSGKGLWTKHEQEILAREQRYARPSSLYEEEVADGVFSGLGVIASKGKISLTRTLPTSLVRAWGLQRLPELVRDVKDLHANQPGSFAASIQEIKRMRLPVSGKAAIGSIVEALLQIEREGITSVTMPHTALEIYDALNGKYFDPYLRTQCSHCEETAELCPHCEGEKLDLGGEPLTCRECGATISDENTVTLRCINGHVTAAPRDEAWSIAPNHWLQKRMARIFAEIDRPWSERADYFHVEGSSLYRLRKGEAEGLQLPALVQNYINNFWEQVAGQVHTGSGDVVVRQPRLQCQPGEPGDEQQQEEQRDRRVLKSYKDFDLRMRGNASTGYTVEAAVSGGGSVPPQPLVLPADESFELGLDGIQRRIAKGESLQSVGEALFAALFPPRVAKFWTSAVGALDQDTGLRIRLHTSPPELMAVPWELAFDEGFLGLHLRFPMIRYLDLPGTPKPLAVQPPLRVLVAVSQPRDTQPLDVSAELAGIRRALAQLPESVDVDVLESTRRDELLSKLRRSYHVLHYIGHGAFYDGEGYLILEDAGGHSDPVSAVLLGQMVMDSSLRLAVLNACDTSMIGLENPFEGLAHQLVRAGMPAVVAMQTSIIEQAAFAFSREFYGALSEGWPVEAAVQQGRRSIMTVLGNDWSKRIDWAIPTLYMRALNGMMLEENGKRNAVPIPTADPGVQHEEARRAWPADLKETRSRGVRPIPSSTLSPRPRRSRRLQR